MINLRVTTTVKIPSSQQPLTNGKNGIMNATNIARMRNGVDRYLAISLFTIQL